MDSDRGPGPDFSDPQMVASVGECPFATRVRTGVGKLALGLSLVPWVAYGLVCVFRPG